MPERVAYREGGKRAGAVLRCQPVPARGAQPPSAVTMFMMVSTWAPPWMG